MKGDQLLYMHYLIEPPSQPSEVQLTLRYKFVNRGPLQYSNTAEKKKKKQEMLIAVFH